VNSQFSLRVVLITILLGSLCPAKNRASDDEGANLLAKAASLQNIHEKGGPPFQLQMHIHAEHLTSKPMDGDYAEVWMASNKWRREIALPGFTQLEIGDVDSKWLTRSLDFKPRVVYLSEVAVEYFVHPGAQQEAVVKSVRNRKYKGTELRCVELVDSEGKQPRELCFNDAGNLVSETRGLQRFEYGEFSKFATKVFPKAIQVYESDKQILHIRADDLSAPADSRDNLFQHEAAARQLAACDRWPKLVKKVAPQYPNQARQNHQQGTVTLYAVLSGNGEVERTRVLESQGASLDQSASEAVQLWVYSPMSCGTTPLETEIEVQVNYALQY
jgi:TonB family protein